MVALGTPQLYALRAHRDYDSPYISPSGSDVGYLHNHIHTPLWGLLVMRVFHTRLAPSHEGNTATSEGLCVWQSGRTFFNEEKKAGVSSWQPNLHIMATAVPPGGRWMIGGG